MDEDVFCGIENVQRLYMVSCGITIPPNVTPLQLSLKSLILNNNRIKSFPEDYFEGLDLEHLQVDDNLLTSVPPINALGPSLLIFSLSKNLIATAGGLWRNATYQQLQTINFSWNMILTVKVKINAPRLIWLDLRNNNISSMDDPESQDLILHLGKNPLHCDAAMTWAAQRRMSDPETRCASPSCVAGRVLSELGKVISDVSQAVFWCSKSSENSEKIMWFYTRLNTGLHHK